MEVREMKRANQGIYHFLWADRVSRLRKSTDPRTWVSDLGPTPATSHPHAQDTSTRRAADSGLAPGSGPSPARRLGEAALGGSPSTGLRPQASETRKDRDRLILKPSQLECHCSFSPARV